MSAAPLVRIEGIPVLETARMVLRGPQLADFEPFARYFDGPRSQFTGGPLTRELAFRNFGHLVGHWALRGFGFFVMTPREGGAPFGMVGCHFPEGWPEPEIGWAIWEPALEGRGLAREGALAVRAFSYGALGWRTAISLIDAGNSRSQALARALGCSEEGTFHHPRFGASQIWRHPAPEART